MAPHTGPFGPPLDLKLVRIAKPLSVWTPGWVRNAPRTTFRCLLGTFQSLPERFGGIWLWDQWHSDLIYVKEYVLFHDAPVPQLDSLSVPTVGLSFRPQRCIIFSLQSWIIFRPKVGLPSRHKVGLSSRHRVGLSSRPRVGLSARPTKRLDYLPVPKLNYLQPEALKP